MKQTSPLGLSIPLGVAHTFLGLLIIVLSTTAIILYVGNLDFIHFYSKTVLMSYTTAFFFLVCGLNLILRLTRLKSFGGFLALLSLVVSLCFFADIFLNLELGIRHFLLYSPTENGFQSTNNYESFNTIEFVIISLAICLLYLPHRYFSISSAALGSVIFGFGIFGLTAHFFNITDNQEIIFVTQQYALTELTNILTGIGIIISGWDKENKGRFHFPVWMIIIISVFFLTITLDIYFAVSSQQQVSVNFALKTRAIGVEHLVLEDITERSLTFQELVNRRKKDSLKGKTELKRDAETVFSIFDDVRSIHLLDANGQLKDFVSQNGNKPLEKETLHIPREENTISASPVFVLENGKQGFYLHTPIHQKGIFQGFLVGAIELEDFLDDVLPTDIKDDFNVVIYENDSEVFETKDKEHFGKFVERTAIFNGTEWKIRIYPEKPLNDQLNPILPEIYLSIGIILSILLSLFIYYLKTYHFAIRRNNLVNRRLFREIDKRKILSDNLAQARDAALESSRTKAYFLANMSHEIRTPMNGVIGASELLINTKLSKEQLEYARTIQSSGEILMKLITEILDLTKIEENKMKLEEINFHLSETIKKLIDLFTPMAERKRVIFKAQIREKMNYSLIGDQNKLEQVLINLISNAIKFTEIGSVMVEASIVDETDEEAELKFIVMDTGIGISNTAQNHLFEPFVQADISTTRKYGGTGLGLTICKKLVELMGGKIGVSSQPEIGSTFWFTVTFKKRSVSTSNLKTDSQFSNMPVTALAESGNYSFYLPEDTPRVLLVEDNATNQLVTKRQVEKLGFQIEIANNGQKALKKLKQNYYDIILMDCQMPVMDGYEATREIRLLEKNSGRLTPIIALTAHATEEDSAKCFAVGMNGYLSKPVRLEKLSKVFQLWLRDSAAATNQAMLNQGEMPQLLKKQNSNDEITERINLLIMECGKDGIAEIIRVFLDDMLKKIVIIQHLIRQPDKYEELAREAHTLKGACLNFGAIKLANLGNELEKIALINDYDFAFRLVEKIATEFEQLYERLELTLHKDFSNHKNQ